MISIMFDPQAHTRNAQWSPGVTEKRGIPLYNGVISGAIDLFGVAQFQNI